MKVKRPLQIILVFNTRGPFSREVLAGVGAYVKSRKLDWRMTICNALAGSLDGADGYILDTESVHPEMSAMPGNVPCVYVAPALTAAPQSAVPLVYPDNAALVAEAVGHLRETSATRMAFYSRPRYREQPWAQERIAAFRQLLGPQADIWQGGDAPANSAEEALKTMAWIRRLGFRTGIVAVNDSSARELLSLCQQLGRDIPQDISIVGIDHDPLVAALSPIDFSSVRQPHDRIGQTAAELLHRRIQMPDEATPMYTPIAPEGLHLANSSGKAPGTLYAALGFIRQNLGQSIKSQQVADHVGVSRATLERLFLKQLESTVHDEIFRQRIALAKTLLRSGDMATADVARQSGFKTAQYMHYVFKKEFGTSPKEFAAGNTDADD
ncbi:substrate-binding domain-containing protein [Uliginosibacterium gangwonense]|uniref:AraC family transcriptional regulator n=1 Tax=Uliginosibacterium gangwonense TaxID=392736 RepID=UPI00037F98EA|nr:substrate-binding domain-containing protein [Uliginosibacterium gangwonense]